MKEYLLLGWHMWLCLSAARLRHSALATTRAEMWTHKEDANATSVVCPACGVLMVPPVTGVGTGARAYFIIQLVSHISSVRDFSSDLNIDFCSCPYASQHRQPRLANTPIRNRRVFLHNGHMSFVMLPSVLEIFWVKSNWCRVKAVRWSRFPSPVVTSRLLSHWWKGNGHLDL